MDSWSNPNSHSQKNACIYANQTQQKACQLVAQYKLDQGIIWSNINKPMTATMKGRIKNAQAYINFEW